MSSREKPNVVCVRSLVPKREELRLLRDLVRHQRGARQLDHGADHVVDLRALLFEHLFRHAAARSSVWFAISFSVADSGIMTSGSTFTPFFATSHGRFEDGARLHLGDLRIGDAETAAAMSEHRVELVQLFHPTQQLRQRFLQLGCALSPKRCTFRPAPS